MTPNSNRLCTSCFLTKKTEFYEFSNFYTSSMKILTDRAGLLCATKSYKEDEGWPLGLTIQVVIPNHHKLLWSKAMVVSVMGKGEAVTSSGTC